jgi:hypothetical protein
MTYNPIDISAFSHLWTDGTGYSEKDRLAVSGIDSNNSNFWTAAKLYAAAQRSLQNGDGARRQRNQRHADIEVSFKGADGSTLEVSYKTGELIYVQSNGRCSIRTGTVSAKAKNGSVSQQGLWQRLGWVGPSSPAEAQQRQDVLAAFAATADRRCHAWSAARQVGMGGFLLAVLAAGLRLVQLDLKTAGAVLGFAALGGYGWYQHSEWAHHAGFTWAVSSALGGTSQSKQIQQGMPVQQGTYQQYPQFQQGLQNQQGFQQGIQPYLQFPQGMGSQQGMVQQAVQGPQTDSPVSQNLRDPTDSWAQAIGDSYVPDDYSTSQADWTFMRRTRWADQPVSRNPIDIKAFFSLWTEGTGYSKADRDTLDPKKIANFYAASAVHAAALKQMRAHRGTREGQESVVAAPAANGGRVSYYAKDLIEPSKDATGAQHLAIRLNTNMRIHPETMAQVTQSFTERLGWDQGCTPSQQQYAQIVRAADRRCHTWSQGRQVAMGGFLFVVLAVGLKQAPLDVRWAGMAVGFGVLYAYCRYQHGQWAQHTGFALASSLTLAGCVTQPGNTTVYRTDYPLPKDFQDPTDPWAQGIGASYVPQDFDDSNGYHFAFPKKIAGADPRHIVNLGV